MWQFWLIASGIFFVIEMITVGFLVFWLGIAALITMVVSFITDSLILPTAVFVISSILLIVLTKPFVQKFMNSKDTVVTNAYSIIGKHGLVIEDIDSISGTGQIKVDGEVWSAKCSDSTFIPKGSNIKILKIDGVKAVVTTSTTIESDSEILN